MSVYYNEIDQFAAAWLRELMKERLIPDGEVDERSILDVLPSDLAGFRQCHFFAGVGGWAEALGLVGWSADREVWTGSCPCQPFSAAGKGDGFADERHLWPAFFWLIEQRRPRLVFGEQVESPAARLWIDLVSTDLEALGYASGPVDLPAAGVGSPQIRQRLFWVADCDDERSDGRLSGRARDGRDAARLEPERLRAVERMADVEGGGLGVDRSASRHAGHSDQRDTISRLARSNGRRSGSLGPRQIEAGPADQHRISSTTLGLVNGLVTRLEGLGRDGDSGVESRRLDPDSARSIAATGATRGAWAGADWLYCRDETFRPVEPGTFPLAYGVPARVGRLRGYGNAIVPEVAAAFIEAYLSIDG